MEKKQFSSTQFNYFLFLAAAFIIAVYFTNLRFIFSKEAERATLYSLIEGNADIPFQYRALVPWIVGFLYRLNLPFLDSPIRLFQIVEFLSVFFLIIAFRSYISLFIKNDIIASLFSFSMVFILPFNYIFYSRNCGALYYPSDIPSILFFTIGLILIYRKNLLIYYPLFIIATFNRETTIFLTLIYLFTSIERNKIIPVLSHCFFQAVIWLLIKKYLAVLYADNQGPGLFLDTFFMNLSIIANPAKVGLIASSFGFIWIAVIFYLKLITDKFIKRSLLVVVPFLFGMFIVGAITELRIYGELTPVILSAFLLIIKNLLHFDISEKGGNYAI